MGRGKIMINGVEYGGADIASELSSTSTNNEAAGAKAVYDELSAINTELGNKVTSSQFSTALQTKVSVVDGKGLSTNDYTTAEKNKLAGLSNTVVDSALSTTSTNPVQNKAVTAALNGKAASSHTHTKSQILDYNKNLTSEDLDDMKKVGFYYAGENNTVTNKPDGVDAFGLEVLQSANGWFTQILYSSNMHQKSYRRWFNATTWFPWAIENGYVGQYDYDMCCLLDWLTTHNISDYFYISDKGGDIVRSNGHGFTTVEGLKFLFMTMRKHNVNTNYWNSWLYFTSDNSVGGNYQTDITSYGGSIVYTNRFIELGDVTYYAVSDIRYAYGMGASNGGDIPLIITDAELVEHRITKDFGDVPSNVIRLIADLVFEQNKTLEEIQAMAACCTSALNSKAASSHTHNYAGSSSAGGVATSAAKLATARTIALSGDVSGSTTFDGSGNASIETALAKEITVNKLYIGSKKAKIYESSSGPTSYSLYIQPAADESIYLANGSHYTIAGYSTSKGVILGEMSKALDVGIYGKTITVDGPVTFKSDITCANLTATSGITAPGASYSTLGLVKLNDYTTITDSTGLALPATEKNPNISGSLANQISHLNTDYKCLVSFYYDGGDRSADFTINDIRNYKFIAITLIYARFLYDSVMLPSCLISNYSGFKLYREGTLAGVVTFNSNTSVTIEQPNLDHSPIEVFGIK